MTPALPGAHLQEPSQHMASSATALLDRPSSALGGMEDFASMLDESMGKETGFEGSVDSLGLVTAGSTGTIPVVAVATMPGTRPVVARTDSGVTPAGATAVEATKSTRRTVTEVRVSPSLLTKS